MWNTFKALYQDVQDKLQTLEKEIIDCQEACQHPEEFIIEGKYKSYHYLSSTPPFLVCRKCGYAEEGWGKGYTKLPNKGRYPSLPYDDALKFALHMLRQNGSTTKYYWNLK